MVTEASIEDVVRRVVGIARPERIILFGSAARGELADDIDLLVVKSGAHRRKLAGEIYLGLADLGQPVDVVVVTPEDLERYAESPGLVIGPALREGKVVYAA